MMHAFNTIVRLILIVLKEQRVNQGLQQLTKINAFIPAVHLQLLHNRLQQQILSVSPAPVIRVEPVAMVHVPIHAMDMIVEWYQQCVNVFLPAEQINHV